ncbi:MAG: rod shape-determining protein [Planctomycetes bacterium]|nr:rod shape-determining protein [Planctomycetota bacterium]MDA0948219.1 MamK family actin-like protein [Planctomycetota bacterium]
MSEEHTEKEDQGVLYVGIDLGTSRTSVSSSNGVRDTVESFVGYPKDPVARKLLGRDVLFGEEAREKRLSLRLHRPLEHGVLSFNKDGEEDSESLRAAQDLVREIVKRAKPRADELVYAVIGVPAQASIHNKDAILKAARESVDSVMLCSEPFAVAYGQNMLDDALVIDIGAGTVDLCRMHGTMPEESDQLTMTTAGDFVDEELGKEISAKFPDAQHTKQMIKAIKEKHSTVQAEATGIVVKLPVNGKPTEFDITDCVKTACARIVPPIVEGLGKLIGTFDPEFQERLKGRVVLAGGGSMIKGLDRAIEAYMQEHLGSGTVVRLEEPIYGGANGALNIAHDMPEEYWTELRG